MHDTHRASYNENTRQNSKLAKHEFSISNYAKQFEFNECEIQFVTKCEHSN